MNASRRTPRLMLTLHSVRRYQQRIEPGVAEDVAALRLHEATRRCVPLPMRQVLRDWLACGRKRPRRERQRGGSYYLCGQAVCAVRDDRIVTVLQRVGADELATLLTWALTGVWVEARCS